MIDLVRIYPQISSWIAIVFTVNMWNSTRFSTIVQFSLLSLMYDILFLNTNISFTFQCLDLLDLKYHFSVCFYPNRIMCGLGYFIW